MCLFGIPIKYYSKINAIAYKFIQFIEINLRQSISFIQKNSREFEGIPRKIVKL